MASITSTGIGSGLDVEAIVSQLMAVERRPLNLLNQQESSLNTQLSNFGRLQSLTSALRDAASSLTSLTLWKQSTATSRNPEAVTVSAGSGAAAGSYAVKVDSLAAGQTISSAAFAGSTSELSEGTLTIELGRWTGASSFAAKAGTSAVTIAIGPGETSLESIRDKINAAGAGVTASIVNDASGARLALRSATTGAENAFRITATETTDDGVAATGLSALGFTATSGAPMTRNQTAANANATINGISVSSASNTLEGVIDGLTVNLLQTTSAPVEVTVAPDSNAVKTEINDFVKAFNDLAVFIRDQTKYDAATKKGGALQGDRTVIALQQQLRAVLNEGSSASATYSRLSDIGLVMKSDGTLEVKSGKLDEALKNLPELKKLLATDGATSAASGFMDRYRDLTGQVLDLDGAIESRNASLKARLSNIDRSQAAMETRLGQTEARLRAQYQSLDATMAQLSGLSSYLNGQLASITNGKT